MADAISAKTAWALAKAIKGGSKRKGPTNGTATVVRVDQDGTHWVRISGSDVETPVNGAITVDAKAGDTVQYHLEDTRISITGNASNPSVGRDYVGGEVSVVTKQVEAVRASIVETNELVAAKATIGQLEAERARIGELEADHVSVSDFQAEQANIDSLQVATADIDTIRANSAKVQNLTAAQLEADHATIGTLDTTYMHANMSNADVAWIQNGTIKDGAIVSAMINDVSANKLTAGTINGSVINVTNLNADNITAGTINGQRIGEGSLSLDKLSEDVYTEAEIDNIVEGLNDRIDGAIETHTGATVPTLNNAPASSWNTTKLRDEHVGDVYYVVNSQSQQNGYCYRFTKSGSTYSWQLIKDSDVTAALSRLTTAEGKITTFDSDISTLKTDTGTLTTKTESLETRMSDAESDILDKVDTTTFNEVSDTVDQHSQTISQHTTAISNKADSSTVTAVTNRVSKNEQDISGINTTIGELQDTVETKADGSTVETVSNRLNTVSNTVDGHTQTLTSVQNTLSSKADSSTVSTLTTQVNNVSDTVDGHTSQLSSITTTQTTIQSTLDKTVKSSIQLWYSKANTTAPSKPTSQVTSTSTSGNAWRTVVPAYNASYPHYFYCWQYEYVDGTYGWSAVVRDIAMGESQSTARTADSNASAAVTTANTASTNASTALTTANTASTNASEAKTAATTASTTASEAKTTAETAASDASTAKTNAASAVTTANSASTTATNAQITANANIKSSVQLWFTKANSTAPSKPTSVVSTSNANTANAWNLVVPVWNSSYPHYFYCYQQQKGDGNYQWTDVVYDRATSEAQQLANTTSTSLTTLQEDYATYKQTTTENVSSIGSRLTTAEGKISTAETNISQNAQNIELKVSKEEFDKLETRIDQTAESIALSAYQSAQPNLTPFFSSHNADGTYPNGSSDGYWQPTTDGAYNRGDVHALEDGWAHVSIVSGTQHEFAPKWVDDLKAGDSVTMLIEWRNATYTGNGGFHYNRNYPNNTQLPTGWGWGQGPSMNSESGSARKVLTVGSATGNANWNALIDFTFTCYDGASHTWEGDIRVSFYRGEYDGPYKPYSGTQLYASQTELKVANDSISTKVDKGGVISSINQSSESVSINANKINLQGAVTISDLSSDAQSATLNSNISVGGRNLLRNTNWNTETIKKFKTVNSSTKVLGNAIGEWHKETQATLGFDASGLMTITAPNNTARYGIYQDVSLLPGHYILSVDTGSFFKSHIDSVQWPAKNIINGSNSRNSVEIDVAEEAIYRVYIACNNGAVMYGNYMKLEKGNKATDWTPAPEDVDSAISDAAKTATSYVTDITGGGIMVHPSDDATSGVRITSDVDIMRGGTSVINIGTNDAVRIGVDDNAHVKMLLESDSMEIDNEVGDQIFVVEANRSGTTTETVTANDVAVWSGINDVTTATTYTITDAGTTSGTATAIVTVDNVQYELDSSQATTTVTVGSNVTATLTSSGVTYVRGLMTVVEEDEEGVETTTYLQCSLSVRYVHIVADSAIMTLDGRQVINGERKLLTLSNDQWSSSNETDNFVLVETKGPSNKTYAVAFGVGSSGSTRGVYDSTNGDWIIYRNSIGQTGISSSKRPIVINGTNFSVDASGNVRSVGTGYLNNLSMTGWVRKLTSDWSSSNQKATFLWAENSVTGQSLAYGIANNGYHRGIYDGSDSRWIVVKYQSGQVSYYGLHSNFEVDAATILSGSTSISAGGIQTGTTSITKSGWYPIAISGWNANSRYALPARLYLSARGNGTGTISWGIYNPDSTNARSPTVTVYVLWARGN